MFSLMAPAKINRFLHIIGQRADGYHLLQTLFQYLDYGDTLSFALRDDAQIVLEPQQHPDIPLEQNLIYRAACLLQKGQHIPKGATITWDKKIPLGSGLGGASSNAATCLVGLNQLWGLSCSCEYLMALGLQLGADVPFFLLGHSAWGEGIGEQLTQVSPRQPWVLVLSPPCIVQTAKMYAHLELTRDTPAFRIAPLNEWEVEDQIIGFRNDFEPLVRSCYPEVDYAFKWLSNFGAPRLSGSGASVFACFNDKHKAIEVAQQIPSNMKGFVAKCLNHSPLRKAARM